MKLAYIILASGLAVACGDDSGSSPGTDGSVADARGGGGDGGGGGDAVGATDSTFTSSDGSGSGSCTADPTPPGTSSCPSECTGGCDAHTCTIDCRNHNCDGDNIVCPQEYACVVDCYGVDNCDGGSVTCPDLYACTLKCGGGTDACGNQELNCGSSGSCRMECDGDACPGETITCGAGACSGACTPGADMPTPVCGSSCLCAGC